MGTARGNGDDKPDTPFPPHTVLQPRREYIHRMAAPNIHRMAAPIRWHGGPAHDAKDSGTGHQRTASAACCTSASPCGQSACTAPSCVARGVSVTTVARGAAARGAFRAAHQVLGASLLHADLCKTSLGKQHPEWHAKPDTMAQAVTEEQLEAMVSEAFKEGDVTTLPTCAVRSSAPPHVRSSPITRAPSGRQHVLLQSTQNLPVADLARTASALDPGWRVCPFHCRVGAGDDHLETLEDGTPPTPRSRLAGAVSETLTRLLAARCKIEPSNAQELFELAYALCRLPEEEPFDLSKQPYLCRCLLQAHELCVVDPSVPGYDDMVAALCRAVGKSPEEVDLRHVWNRERPARTLIILGDLLIARLAPGCEREREAELTEADALAQRSLDSERTHLPNGGGYVGSYVGDFCCPRKRDAARILFQVSTPWAEEGKVMNHGDVMASATDTNVVLPCAEIAGAVCQLSAQSVKEFCRLAAQPNDGHREGRYAGMDALLYLRQRREAAPKSHLLLAHLLRDKKAVFHTRAGPVVSVLHGLDSASLGALTELLNDRSNGLAAFLAAYLSCKLRMAARAKDVRAGILPLATDALLIAPSSQVATTSTEPAASVVPPTLKHETFFVAVDLGRQGLDDMHGRLTTVSVAKGVHLLCRLHSLRSGFCLWFVEKRATFPLSKALHRLGSNSADDASLWSSRLLDVTRASLASAGLVATGDSIAASDRTRKIVAYVGWSRRMLDLVLPQILSMLQRVHRVEPQVVLNLRVTGLDTESPTAEALSTAAAAAAL